MNHRQILDLDKEDPLAEKRQEFYLPENTIYLDGNSLGPLPVRAGTRAQQLIGQEWGRDLITSWNVHNWIDMPVEVGEKIAKLIGAGNGQVVCCDSISINLFKLLACALQLQADRRLVLSQTDNFPTDLYVVDGLNQLLGDEACKLQLVAEDAIEDALQNDVAVLLLTQVNFRSGKKHDMQRLTDLAHQHGILVIWDLAHSAGVLPIQLDNWNVDFAVGCGYKYLNGGPGAPAFLYVAERHLEYVTQPLKGWMGHESPFNFTSSYIATKGISQFLSGTPPIISMGVLDAALDIFAGTEIEKISAKSIALSELFLTLMEQNKELTDLKLLSPRDANRRGSQLAFTHASAFAICQALIEQNIIADFRSPDILRIGISPLILRFEDIWLSVQALTEIMQKRLYEKASYQQKKQVT